MANVGKVVLVVDDSPSIRREVKVILEREGYVVREAGSEFGMFSAIEEYSIRADLILMDLTLNEANGFDLVTKLRAVEKYKNIPVVILTEHADRDNVYMAKILGVQGYIVKPVNAKLLKERVGSVFSGTPGRDKAAGDNKKTGEHVRHQKALHKIEEAADLEVPTGKKDKSS